MRMTSVPVTIDAGDTELAGELAFATGTRKLVVFVHGSGSNRMSPRNRYIAEALQERGIGTLLFDLGIPGYPRFDLGLHAEHVTSALRWLVGNPELRDARIGLFGAGTGAAAALVAAGELREQVYAVASRGGRPDLAGSALPRVRAPTVLIVGGADRDVLALNRLALARLRCPRALHVVEGAGPQFDERGALADVIEVAAHWFAEHLAERPPVWAVGPSTGAEAQR
jgi:pimeloyl-ACP methyl ester carboxylesterase